MWVTPPILAERVSSKIRAFYKRQEPFDIGEGRPRLGVDERRAQSKLRPHSEHIVSVRGKDEQ